MKRSLNSRSLVTVGRRAASLLVAFVAGFGAISVSHAQAQGPIAGKPNDGTPKPGLFVSGPMRWGRLVDIWAIDGSANPVQITKKQGNKTIADPFYLDTLVGESIGVSKTVVSSASPPVSLTLKRDPVSGAQIIIIGAQFEKSPKSRFQIALKEIIASVGTVAIGGPTSLPPYSQVPRDAAIAINFDRPVNPKTIGPETIQVYVGSSTVQGKLPPAPFLGRFIWKPELPKTVVFDPTISSVDDSRIADNLQIYNANPGKVSKFNPQILPINSLGFPASLSSTTFNVGVFIPAVYNITGGVTKILLAKDGTALDINKSVTKYIYTPNGGALADGLIGVARVFRSGTSTDVNQGFTADPTSPAIIGSQQVIITNVQDFNTGDSRVVTFKYLNSGCDIGVRVGDSLQQGNLFSTVSSVDQGSVGDADPNFKVVVNYLQAQTFNTTDPALITTPYTHDLNSKVFCFVILQPQPGIISDPLSNVDPQAAFTIQFSKPMDVSKVNSLRNFVLLTDSTVNVPSNAKNFDLVIGNVIPSPDLRAFKFVPYLPMPHTQGTPEALKLILVAGSAGVTDLAGNPLTIPTTSFSVPFTLRSTAVSNTSRFFNLRFDSLFENATPPIQMVGGEVTKPSAQEIGPRPASHFSRDVDQSVPIVSVMSLFNQGIQTPLSALGSRLQTVYRHVDMNLSINSISDIDLDVENLYWAPFAGVLNVSDYFEHIRIDLNHSLFHPDEWINVNLLPQYPSSGLSLQSFAANNFDPVAHPPGKVYEGAYTVNQNLLFTVNSGRVMMPWPKFTKTYTWRDTSYGSLRFGGANGNGVNPDQYYTVLNLPIPTAGASADKPYVNGKVPSVGLPLLMDFRVYPADDPNTKGLNGFLLTIAVTSSSFPAFRVFSTGGLDTSLTPKTVVPDVDPDGVKPMGGYYPPGSTQGTPGTRTQVEGPEVYYGRVDFAVKVSRAFTHFYNLVGGSVTAPIFKSTNVLLLPTVQPPNTSVTAEFRGATNVLPSTAGALNDARCFDAYGDVYVGGATPPTIPPPVVTSGCGSMTGLIPPYNAAAPSAVNFTSNIKDLDTKGFIQMRFTFTNDIVNNVSPRLNAFGIAYSNP